MAVARLVAQSLPVAQPEAEAPAAPEHPAHSAIPAEFVSSGRLSPLSARCPAGPQAKEAAGPQAKEAVGQPRSKRTTAQPPPTGPPKGLVWRQRPARRGGRLDRRLRLSLEMSLARETCPPNAARIAQIRPAPELRRIRTQARRLQNSFLHQFKTLERRGLIPGELKGEPALAGRRAREPCLDAISAQDGVLVGRDVLEALAKPKVN